MAALANLSIERHAQILAVALPVLKTLGATLTALGIYKCIRLIYAELTSPLRDLPGPPSPSWIYGHYKEIGKEDAAVPQERWVEQYGPVIKYFSLFGTTRLFTMDSKAMNHVVMNTHIWQKPGFTKYNLSQIVGAGVLVVEGDKHKQQRKVMTPAFGPTQIRELTEVFLSKSIQLRDIWASEIQLTSSGNRNLGNKEKEGVEPTTMRFDVLSWLSRTTLDIIGLAGFNYSFNALNDQHEQNELNAAFSTIFHAGTSVSLIPMIKGLFPALRFLPGDKDKSTRSAQSTMRRIGTQLLHESKMTAQDKSTSRSRDLLSLLVQSNLDTDLPQHQRMSDDEVVDQVPTFLVAGHETTSTATTWALYSLSIDQRVQTKLRNELLQVGTETPTMEQLNALAYLDIFVREVLRVHAPVAVSLRVATQDDVLPLSKPFVDRKGVTRSEIRVSKGQTIQIPILAMNRNKEIWGEDAKEFRPERWESTPEAAAQIPGVWGNMMSFLGGPRSCIGYRFSLIEMKALLFTLVRAFEFELAVPVDDITKRTGIVQRPLLKSDPKGNQLPLLVKIHDQARHSNSL